MTSKSALQSRVGSFGSDHINQGRRPSGGNALSAEAAPMNDRCHQKAVLSEYHHKCWPVSRASDFVWHKYEPRRHRPGCRELTRDR
jgi:hypothetical protein